MGAPSAEGSRSEVRKKRGSWRRPERVLCIFCRVSAGGQHDESAGALVLRWAFAAAGVGVVVPAIQTVRFRPLAGPARCRPRGWIRRPYRIESPSVAAGKLERVVARAFCPARI